MKILIALIPLLLTGCECQPHTQEAAFSVLVSALGLIITAAFLAIFLICSEPLPPPDLGTKNYDPSR